MCLLGDDDTGLNCVAFHSLLNNVSGQPGIPPLFPLLQSNRLREQQEIRHIWNLLNENMNRIEDIFNLQMPMKGMSITSGFNSAWDFLGQLSAITQRQTNNMSKKVLVGFVQGLSLQ